MPSRPSRKILKFTAQAILVFALFQIYKHIDSRKYQRQTGSKEQQPSSKSGKPPLPPPVPFERKRNYVWAISLSEDKSVDLKRSVDHCRHNKRITYQDKRQVAINIFDCSTISLTEEGTSMRGHTRWRMRDKSTDKDYPVSGQLTIYPGGLLTYWVDGNSVDSSASVSGFRLVGSPLPPGMKLPASLRSITIKDIP